MSRILYCHCAYARVVPLETRTAVLERLAASGVPFDAVPDLCEMAARGDPQLAELAGSDEPLHVAACYPRAVRWLFASAGVNVDPARTVIHNMRTEPANAVADALLSAGSAPRSSGEPSGGEPPSGEPA